MTNYTGGQIKAERLRRKWTQRKFADMIGVTPVAVSKWENDLSEPSYNHMRRIREVFINGAPDPDRLAELEAEISRLRQQQDDLDARVLRLVQDSESFRAVVTKLLAIPVEPASGEALPSEPQAGQ